MPVVIKEVESPAGGCRGADGGPGKNEVNKKNAESATRVVEIEAPVDQGAWFLRQIKRRRFFKWLTRILSFFNLFVDLFYLVFLFFF